jgi:hypothetical protein
VSQLREEGESERRWNEGWKKASGVSIGKGKEIESQGRGNVEAYAEYANQ